MKQLLRNYIAFWNFFYCYCLKCIFFAEYLVDISCYIYYGFFGLLDFDTIFYYAYEFLFSQQSISTNQSTDKTCGSCQLVFVFFSSIQRLSWKLFYMLSWANKIVFMTIFFEQQNVFHSQLIIYIHKKIFLTFLARSPIYTHLVASLEGLSTIRVFKAQELITKEFSNLQNNNSSAFFMYVCANKSFGFWLDFICCIYNALVIFTLFFVKNGKC